MEKGSLDSQEKDAPDVLALLADLPNFFPGPMAYWDKQERCVFSNSNYLEWFVFSDVKLLPVYVLTIKSIENTRTDADDKHNKA